jgi:hypothetical protein
MESVAQWRNRAGEIRRVADAFAVPSARDTMLRIAQTYERKADDLEKELPQRSVPKPEAC